MASWGIVESELIEWLGSYGGPRYHAVLSDPPYALISIAKRFGKAGSAPAQEGSDGRYSRLSTGFMGQKWDGFESLEHYQKWVSEWSELMIQRLLYPGAVCLFFGGTRTFHHLGVGLENGGFEIVDSILIPWIHGQGFPKAIRPFRDADHYLSQVDSCQCDEGTRNTAYTFPLHSVLDCICTAQPWAEVEDDILSSAPNAKNGLLDSLDDYHLSAHSYDGPLRLAAMVALAFLLPQEYAQEHSHFSALLDDLAFESLHSLCLALYSDLPSMQDFSIPDQKDRVSSLLLEYESSRQNLGPNLHSYVNSMVGSLDVSKLMGDGKSAYRNLHICSLVFSLPLSILRLLYTGEGSRIIPQLDICGNCGKLINLWSGHASHLKPSWEPVFVCRAPRRGLTRTWTFAELAVEFGTGALNIDGARIGTSETLSRKNDYRENDATYDGGPWKAGEFGTGDRAGGRWPANFVLSHTDDCVKVGEYMAEGRQINRWKSDMKPFGGGAGEEYDSEEMPPDTVEHWACVPGCPVRRLDDQVGDLKSGDNAVRTKTAEGIVYGQGKGMEQEPTGEPELTYGDPGGPSRFFYTAKASRSEKDKGLEYFWWKRTDDGFERISLSEYEQLDKRERAHGNIHPTCKPLELLRYLATLSLPPKQDGRARRILVPFSGSGSEVVAAVQAGWDEVTGVEMTPIYNEMAEARLRGSIGMF